MRRPYTVLLYRIGSMRTRSSLAGQASERRSNMKGARTVFGRIWNSPTFTTWGSLLARMGTMTVLLPFVLASFGAEDATLWLLFSTVLSLQVVCDLGFSQTFSRAVANARGGASIDDLGDLRTAPGEQQHSGKSNVETLERVISTLGYTYLRLAVISIALLAAVASYFIAPSISRASESGAVWLAWGVILGTMPITLWGNAFAAYLLGSEQIALVRRWETLFALLATGSATAAISLGGGLLMLVLIQQGWALAAVARNALLCMADPIFRRSFLSRLDSAVFRVVWPNAWRSGIGVLMGFGLYQTSGLIYARVGSAESTASYLLALRLIQVISLLSQAPFYSKIPTLAKLRALGTQNRQIDVARRGMLLAHLTYCAGFLAVGLLAEPLLVALNSQTSFVPPLMWTLLGAAFFMERLGAMHLQLYSTTNHIIWHYANGFTGLLMIAVALGLFPLIGDLAFPISMLAAYTLLYCPISLWHSYRAFSLSVRTFELPVSTVPALGTAAIWATIHALR